MFYDIFSTLLLSLKKNTKITVCVNILKIWIYFILLRLLFMDYFETQGQCLIITLITENLVSYVMMKDLKNVCLNNVPVLHVQYFKVIITNL